MLKVRDREPLPVKARSRLYSVRSMHTDSLDLCDVERCLTDGVCEVCRVGCRFYDDFMLFHIFRTKIWFVKEAI